MNSTESTPTVILRYGLNQTAVANMNIFICKFGHYVMHIYTILHIYMVIPVFMYMYIYPMLIWVELISS